MNAQEQQTDQNPLSIDPDTGYFQRSYRLSRERLLEQSHILAAQHPTMVDSRSIKQRGPEGETLATDFVLFGARKPKHVLVISSGTHGAEGFCGSAIQHQMLCETLPNLRLSADTAVVILHANNPYGFAWLRRVNESNVDINRNFRDCFDDDDVSPDYESLFEPFNPPDLTPENETIRWSAMEQFAERHGDRRLQQAFLDGQYKYPQGMQFGGHRQEPCVTHLLDLVREHFADSQSVTWLDIHTGLGELGDCELIMGADPKSAAYQTANHIWDNVVSANSDESISTPLRGLMDQGVAAAVPTDCRFAFVFAEFGTYPVYQIFRAIRADNWLTNHGPDDILLDPQARAIKAQILEAFRPDRAVWRTKILATGAKLIAQAIDKTPGLTMRSR